MAEAKVLGKKVRIQLELSEEEFALLHTILMNTGGDMDNSPRKYAHALLKVTEPIVMEHDDIGALYEKYTLLVNQAIYFK